MSSIYEDNKKRMLKKVEWIISKKEEFDNLNILKGEIAFQLTVMNRSNPCPEIHDQSLINKCEFAVKKTLLDKLEEIKERENAIFNEMDGVTIAKE